LAVRVLDIALFDQAIPDACELIIADIESGDKNNKRVSATGAHGIVHARQDPAFRAVLESFYMNLPDGMPGVWIGRLKGARSMKRCYGPAFFREMMIRTADKNIRHFFCGGVDGVAEELQKAVAVKFSNHNVVGTYCPPYLPVGKYDYAAIGAVIQQSQPDIVWIGLSTPKQEIFASHLAKHTKVGFIITVGAAFDFHTDRVRQAPPYVQTLGLEWLFRLVMEPRRLWKRYVSIVPRFIYYNFLELFTFASPK
jgi:N-acetylglucosaminyldiphosphoundecaprenol N-acetyl-beta-D-mannosaminyltransferase